MPPVVEANVVATELEKVLTNIATAFEVDDFFFANIKKGNVEKISNRQMRVPLKLRSGGSFQYFDANGGDLGRGSGTIWDKAVVTSVFCSENVEYTKLAQWATDSDRKAVINAVRELTTDSLLELKRQLDGQMQQNGTGVIGTVTTDTPAGGENVIVMTTDGFGIRLTRDQQPIQIWDSALAVKRGEGTITYWDVENSTIKVSPQIASVGVGDVVVTAGLAQPASLPAIYGVPYHHSNASTGTWLGFNRATTPQIRSNRVNAASSPLTLPFSRLAMNKIGNRVGLNNTYKPNAWLHPCQKQAYEEIGQLVSIIQKMPKQEGLDMYFGDNMQLAGAPLREHFNWSKSRIDFVDNKVWGRGEILPIGFYKTDGRSIFEIRGQSGGVATAEIFYMTVGLQFYVNNPAATAYIDNLAIPSGY